MSHLAVLPSIDLYFKFDYNGIVFQLHTANHTLANLRHLYNQHINTANSKAKTDGSSSLLPSLPPSADCRYWLRWSDGRWVEATFSHSLQSALSDSTFFPTGSNERFVCIQCRHKKDPSPNTAPRFSSSCSSVLADLDSSITRASFNELFPRPMNATDPFSGEAVTEIPADDRVLLHNLVRLTPATEAIVVLVRASSLLQYVEMQLKDGNKSVYDVTVEAQCMSSSSSSSLRILPIRRYQWILLMSSSTCSISANFRELYITYSVTEVEYREHLDELRRQSDLYKRLQFLINDLLNLSRDESIEKRILFDVLSASASSDIDNFHYSSIYLSSFYFSEEERQWLYSFPTACGHPFYKSIENEVSRKFKADAYGSVHAGAHVCSSHDIAPLYRVVFGLDWAFYKDEKFKKEHKTFCKSVQKDMVKKQKQAENKQTEDKVMAI